MRNLLMIVLVLASCSKKQDDAKPAGSGVAGSGSSGASGSAGSGTSNPGSAAPTPEQTPRRMTCEQVATKEIRDKYFKDLAVEDASTEPYDSLYCKFDKPGGSSEIHGSFTISNCFDKDDSYRKIVRDTLAKEGKDAPDLGKDGFVRDQKLYIEANAFDDNSLCYVMTAMVKEDVAKALAKDLMAVLPVK